MDEITPHRIKNRRGTEEGGLDEHWELPQHKAEVLALAVLAVTPSRQ